MGRVEDQIIYVAEDLLGWKRSHVRGSWLFQSGSEAAPLEWNPFNDDDDAWQLFTLWSEARQIHKGPGGIAVVLQMPNGDLVTFGNGSKRYCGPLLCQAMAAAVAHYREAARAYKLLEQKRQFRSQQYED